MPENTEATTPDISAGYSAADAYKELQAQESTPDNEDKDETPEPEETEEESAATADEEPADEPEETEEEDGDLPDLDARIQDALGDNDELKDLWKRQWKGIVKRESRLSEREQAISGFESYITAFADPEHALPAVRQLAEKILSHHGLDLSQLTGAPTTEQEPEFEYESEKKLWQKTQAEIARLRKELDSRSSLPPELESELKELKAERERQRAREERDRYLKQVSERTIRQLDKQHDGWKVDQKMVARALDELPEIFRKDPARAVRMVHAESLARHASERAAGNYRRIPDMPDASSAKGFQVPSNPLDYSAAHAYREVSGTP